MAQVLEGVRRGYAREKVQTGVFGANMEVQLVNDGPVTLELEASPAPRKPQDNHQDKTQKSPEEEFQEPEVKPVSKSA